MTTKHPTETDAREWIAANEAAWEYMVHEARWAAFRGKHVGMKALAEHVRWHVVVRKGQPYRLNNNLVSLLARVLVAEHPEVGPYVERRKSMYDR